LILDLDSTVVTVFGRQEGAAVGYNPRYRGKRSYDPLLCLEANSSFLWMPNCGVATLVRGLAASNCWPVVFSRFLRHRELRVRADAGFGYHPVLEMLEVRPANTPWWRG